MSQFWPGIRPEGLNRRLMLAGAAAAIPAIANAQAPKALLGTPRSVITEPPRD